MNFIVDLICGGFFPFSVLLDIIASKIYHFIIIYMARKRGRKPVKQVASSPEPDLNVADDKEPQIEKQEAQFTDPDGIIFVLYSQI